MATPEQHESLDPKERIRQLVDSIQEEVFILRDLNIPLELREQRHAAATHRISQTLEAIREILKEIR